MLRYILTRLRSNQSMHMLHSYEASLYLYTILRPIVTRQCPIPQRPIPMYSIIQYRDLEYSPAPQSISPNDTTPIRVRCPNLKSAQVRLYKCDYTKKVLEDFVTMTTFQSSMWRTVSSNRWKLLSISIIS